MNSTELKNLQTLLKDKYRKQPETAIVTLKADGKIGESISCKIDTGRSLIEAGLHPATGGSGLQVCSGDLLLEALVACAGVTLSAVATAIGIEIKNGTVQAEGDIDFRGTLGVSKEVPAGFMYIRLYFQFESDADDTQIETLLKLTERYCVIYQTLKQGVNIETVYKQSH
jgi:uncharacterized OsmC-like protein